MGTVDSLGRNTQSWHSAGMSPMYIGSIGNSPNPRSHKIHEMRLMHTEYISVIRCTSIKVAPNTSPSNHKSATMRILNID